MLVINLFLTLLIPFLLGTAILSLFIYKGNNQLAYFEKKSLCFAIGLGFLVIIIYLLGVFKIPITFSTTTSAASAIIILCGVFLLLKKRLCFSPDDFKFKIPKMGFIEYFLLMLIALKTAYVFFEALIKPVIDVDAFQFYSIVAKGIFYTKTFTSPYLMHFMGDKPPFAFFTQGWILLGLNSPDEFLIKIISPVLFLCMLIIFYSILRRYFSIKTSLLFTFFLSYMPFIAFHAKTAYADLPMTFYYSLGTIYLFLFMKDFNNGKKPSSYVNLLLAAIFIGLTIWIKRAGIVLAGCDIIVLLAFLLLNRKWIQKIDLKYLTIAFITIAAIILPWLIFGSNATLGRIITTQAGAEEIAFGAKIGFIISIFFKKIFLYADWNLLWLMFAASVIIPYKNSFKNPQVFLLAIILIDLIVILGQFSSGEMFRWLLDGTLLDRLIMNQAPVVLYFCAEIIGPILEEKGNSSAA